MSTLDSSPVSQTIFEDTINHRMGPRGVLRINCRWASLPQSRSFTVSRAANSGHNRWSKIKHDKGAADARKSKERTKLAYEVFIASKYGGGPNPIFNTRLANAIVSAKKGALDKGAIETAIARGQGKSASGAALEDVTVEAMLPYAAMVIQYQTDQKARVLQEIRSIIKRAGGSVTPTAFMFEKKGRIWFERKPEVSVDNILDEAIEAGAMDVEEEEGQLVVDTDPSATTSVAQRLCEKFGLNMERSEILYDPKEESMVQIDGEQGIELDAVIGSIEDDPGLQNIYMNVAN